MNVDSVWEITFLKILFLHALELSYKRYEKIQVFVVILPTLSSTVMLKIKCYFPTK